MPELALTYAPEPPWLREPKQSGLSIQDILGLQQGQRLQRQEGRLERHEQRLMSESELRQKALLQDMEMQQFRMDEQIRVRDEILQAEKAYASAADEIVSLLETGDVESATNLHLSAGFRHPALAQSKRFITMSQRLEFANKLRETELYHEGVIEARRTQREFAKPEVGRLIELRDRARAEGKLADAQLYEREIAMRQEKLDLTARSRAHTELATTIRQQMRAIDDDDKLKAAEKETRKAELLRQLDQSRRSLLGELEREAPSASETAVQSALTRLDKEIADLEVDLKRNPKQGRLDFGKDNRQIRLDELKSQRQRLSEQPPTPPPPAPSPPPAGPTSAPANPADRQAGQIYRLPLGEFKWTGTGWVKP